VIGVGVPEKKSVLGIIIVERASHVPYIKQSFSHVAMVIETQ